MPLRFPSFAKSQGRRSMSRHPWRLLLPFLLSCLAIANPPTSAQTNADSTTPYATLDRGKVAYRGPVRATPEAGNDAAVIGMILPLSGAQQAEGNALLAAAQLAVAQENAAGGFPSGKRLELLARDESGPWGQASMEILKLYDQDHALAILTSANGTSAHLAEQIANKISIPILTLASDPSTTQANVPWLFRLGPSDTDQAQAFCRRIYRDLDLKQVLLVVQTDHDGRVGAAEFEKAARTFRAAPPLRFEWNNTAPNPESLRETLRANPTIDAIVVWADSPTTDSIMLVLHSEFWAKPVFLCRKATALSVPRNGLAGQFTIGSIIGQGDAQAKFRQAYFAGTGAEPGGGAYEIARCIHTIAAGLRANGTNPVLLRDYLANERGSHDGNTANSADFDAAGNDLQPFAVATIPPAKP
jgi:hypothetical protein